MVQRGERIKIVESLEGGNKKRKKDCSRGKMEEQKKERKMVKGLNPNRSLGRFMYYFITACSLLVFISCLLLVFNSQ